MAANQQNGGINVINVNDNLINDGGTNDSAMGDSATDDSDMENMEINAGMSVEAVLHFFRYEHGKRWNREGNYLLPADKREANRLENQHRLCSTILKKNLILPGIQLPEKARILDLGTSTGIWAIEMAEKHPNSTVVGIDVSPQQTGQPAPENCSWLFYDLVHGIPYEDNYFDFVHIRDMQAAVTWSWDTLVREVHRVLVPGGTVQFTEFIYDHVTRDESRRRQFLRSPVKRMENKFTQLAILRGSTVFKKFTITEILNRQPGFWTMPKEDIKQIPIGHWDKKSPTKYVLGGQMLTNVIDGLNSFGAAFLESDANNSERDDIQRLITEAVLQYKDSTWNMHMTIMYCAVQKVKK